MGLFQDLFSKKSPKKGPLYIPDQIKKTDSGTTISDDRQNYTNTDLTTFRTSQTTAEALRKYRKANPDVSHSAESLLRTIITDNYTLIAKNLEDQTINEEATKTVNAIAARMDRLPTYVDGFSQQSTMAANTESMVLQLLTNGACAAELVLDDALIPADIQVISTTTLKYDKASGERVVPYLDLSSGRIDLNSPTVYIMSLTQDPDQVYSLPWYQAAIQSILSSTEFTDDLRKAFRKASLPRVDIEIKLEEFMKMLSIEDRLDGEKLNAALDNFISRTQSEMNNLNPEDALVHFDSVKAQHLSAGNISSHESVKTHAGLVNGQLSNGLHTLPSILGRGESQSTSSTEALLFLKVTESLQGRVNEIYSYLFTMAMRLMGEDVVVDFAFKKPSLRTEIEEESFLAMRQSRVMELLSYGFISDFEASLILTGKLPSGTFVPLSGTLFYNQKAEPVENPYSNTSVSGKGVNSTKVQKDTKSDAPEGVKSKNTKKG